MQEAKEIILGTIKNKKLLFFISIITVVLNAKSLFASEYELIYKSFDLIFLRLTKDSLVIVVWIVLITILVSFLKHSNKVKEDEDNNRYLRNDYFTSSSEDPFKVTIYENSKLWNEEPYRKISILNNSGEDLEYINGTINFYDNKYRVFSIDVEAHWIKNKYGFKSDKIEEKFYTRWNEFEFFVLKAIYPDKTEENQRYYGNTFHWLPPQLHKKSFVERIIPWDLKWFQSNIIYYCYNYIAFIYKRKIYWKGKITNDIRRSLIKDYIRRVLFSFILVLISGISVVLLYKICGVFYDIIIILANLIKELLIRIFTI